MPIEAKDILSYLGMDESKIDSIDTFKASFNPSYIKKDPLAISEDKELYGKVLGKKTALIHQALKRALKRNGSDLTDAEIKDLTTEEIAEMTVDKIFGATKSKITDLETQLATGADEKVKSIKEQLEKATRDFETLTGANNTLKKEYDDFKTSVVTEAKNSKINAKHKELFGDKFEWAASVKDDKFKKAGVITEFNNLYKLDIAKVGEDEVVIITDHKGNRIPNPKVNSTFMEPEEVVKNFAIENQVWAVNPHKQESRQAPPPKKDIQEPQIDVRRKLNTEMRPATV